MSVSAGILFIQVRDLGKGQDHHSVYKKEEVKPLFTYISKEKRIKKQTKPINKKKDTGLSDAQVF